MLTLDEVIEEITESGLNLGAGDFVDVEVLKDAVKYLKAYKCILEVGDVSEAVKEAEQKLYSDIIYALTEMSKKERGDNSNG